MNIQVNFHAEYNCYRNSLNILTDYHKIFGYNPLHHNHHIPSRLPIPDPERHLLQNMLPSPHILHPDQSDENLKSIINSFDENDYAVFKYDFDMFSSNIAPTKELEPVIILGEKPYGEEGILNGKERFYSQYFTPDLSLDGKTDAQVKKIKKKAQGFFESFCTDMRYFLLDETEFNDHKYSFKQYQIATWLQAAPMADYGKKRVVTLICFLHQLYYWRELHPSIETKPERLAFVNTVTDILDNDTSLPPELIKKWQMIKTEQGRYHPKVVEEFKLDRPPELWQKFNLKGL